MSTLTQIFYESFSTLNRFPTIVLLLGRYFGRGMLLKTSNNSATPGPQVPPPPPPHTVQCWSHCCAENEAPLKLYLLSSGPILAMLAMLAFPLMDRVERVCVCGGGLAYSR